ncbi:MAG: hypothetical protein HZB55_12435 [Deltaproteobacteria bacterium]|nr:hypothetical protein [Deltaproteobacteria bacterium]
MESGGSGVPAVTPRALASFDPLRAGRIAARGLTELARGRCILHVDGHAFIQKVLRAKLTELLAEGSVSLVCRSSAAGALSFLRDHRVDLILSSSLAECQGRDGEPEGVAFLRSCRLLLPGVPFLFYTSAGLGEGDLTQADAVLHKNADFAELLRAIRRLLPALHGA